MFEFSNNIVIFVVSDKQSKEKSDILRAVGAKVIVCPTDVEPTDPRSYYSVSKKLGEEIVKTHPNHLILRTLFKPKPFPFDKAYIDQYTQGDYVDVIAKLLADRVKSWDRKTSGMEYLGTGRKTMYELAKRTRPDVEPNSVEDYIKETGTPIPKDYE